jgi:D-glycero-alpha-D-manno-heptose-7-phosphate kinase
MLELWKMNIKSKAPARIDLAGGTLDLWPLHLFFENTATINCAIDQFAEVSIDIGNESKIGDTPSLLLESKDRGFKHQFNSFGELLESFQGTHKAIGLNSSLWLHARVARHFFAMWRRSAPIHVSTQCSSPAGAGLGGSSALNIALCNAFRKLTLANYTDEELIGVARDLETTVIEVPAGVQDYWSAQFGGVQAIRMDAGRTHRKVFYKQNPFIESHVILCYSGQSRNSGINNWAVYKGFIDKDATIHEAFKNIVKATYKVEEALEKQSFEKFVEGIQQEWEARKKLAPGIATAEMLSVMDMAFSQGAKAAKVCGAGGGGCFIIVAPSEKKNTVQAHLKSKGVHVIDFKVSEVGCAVTS